MLLGNVFSNAFHSHSKPSHVNIIMITWQNDLSFGEKRTRFILPNSRKMETNIGASSIIKWTNQTILGTLNFIFPIVNFVMILILHCSKMKAHHNTFFTLFKVTGISIFLQFLSQFSFQGIYGIFSMITSSNSYWSFCESNRFVFVLRKVLAVFINKRNILDILQQLNGIGSFCFCTGGLMIEIQRFIVIRTSRHSENVRFLKTYNI